MRKLFQLASLVLMGVMLVSIAPASAAFNPLPKAHTTPDSTVCTAICGTGCVLQTERIGRSPFPDHLMQ